MPKVQRPEYEPIELACENYKCKKPFSKSLTPSEFSEWAEEQDDECWCGSCGEELSVSNLSLYCYICHADVDYMSLPDALHWLEERCPHCAGRDVWEADFYSVSVAGSWSHVYGEYDWSASGKRRDELERETRTDYWEGVVHFCSAEEFISIYKERRIKAEPTGLYGRRNPKETKAVCLSETTEPNWEEIKDIHGQYGFVFRKRDMIALEGAPAIYLPQSVIDEMKSTGDVIPRKLWPYLSKLKIPSASKGKKHDFLHEREWRVPRDIDFNKTRPYAVTFPKRRPGIEEEELILYAAQEFQELSGSEFKEDASHSDPTPGAF
ncbi:hypothetical protein CA51_21220 [Rosistilla oblonga]|uniref:hypothetical protein n=1 Tax=Rosistilla oblonga TaxID=2527990 RepID=UPI001188E354|nr:hypothetical protein [Rosistilla oblonga]QDV12241.1 hypothetical protein CA51_21220 [Rosistilla oblonga]